MCQDIFLFTFDFKRSWKFTVSTTSPDDSNLSQRERYLEQKLLDFEKQLSFFKSCVTLVSVNETSQATSGASAATTTTSAKGKGRGKRSTPNQAEQVTAQSSSSFFDRFRPSFSGASGPNLDPSGANLDARSTRSETTSQHSSSAGDQPPPYSESASATEKTVYIKQVDLLLNGAPLDQIDTRETGNCRRYVKICTIFK